MEQTQLTLRGIFTEAAEISDPVARAAFLDTACAGDKNMRTRVERLLAADSDAGAFLSPRTNVSREFSWEQTGDRVGRYRLVERIGRGGCGVVYLAEQEEPVRRRVALKVIKLGMDTQSVVARFEAERQALAMMDHPNIARVFDAGATETGRPYFVMELVCGLKITEYCDQHKLTVRQRLELFIPICHAVQHAHQKGIVHRDLKPSNILVAEHEGVAVPKVIDFGIAKATGQGGEDNPTLTRQDQFVGTPAYMSPEQITLGRDVDTRSDIYSLGVILYELLTGHPPFDTQDLMRGGVDEMRRVIREKDPPRPSTTITRKLEQQTFDHHLVRERLASVRGDMDWIVMKCLEKDRARRYQTANGLASDIRRHLESEPVLARPPSQLYRFQKVVRRHRLAFSAAAAIVLVLVAGVIVSTQQALRARRAEREQIRLRGEAESKAMESHQRLIRRYVGEGNRLVEEGRPFAALPWLVEALALETGDRQREEDERLRIGQALEGTPELRVHLTQSKSVNCVALTPDGQRMATGSDDGILRITDVASGGDVFTNLAMGGRVATVEFSPDGALLAAATLEGDVRIWKTATYGPLTPLLRANDYDVKKLGPLVDRLTPTAQFSRDGKWLLTAWGSHSAQLREVMTGIVVREFTHREIVYHATFSSDGRYVATSSKDNDVSVWDVTTGERVGGPLKHNGMVAWSQFSSDGKTLLTVRQRRHVQLWDWREGQRKGPEISSISVLFSAALSPDGTKMLATSWNTGAALFDVATGKAINNFVHAGGLVAGTFSPDGCYIATACHDNNAWVWRVDNARMPVARLPMGEEAGGIRFSEDSRHLAVVSHGGRARLWDLFPDNRRLKCMPAEAVRWAEFDASGKKAVFAGGFLDGAIWVYEAHSGKLISSAKFPTNDIGCARFSPDGKRLLAFGSGRRILVLDVESGKETVPGLRLGAEVADAVWSPDGTLIVAAGAHAKMWEAATGRFIGMLQPTNRVRAIEFSPDGTQLALGYDGRLVRIWETTTRNPVTDFWKVSGGIKQLHFSPDGRRLAISTHTRGGEGLVEVREIATGELFGKPLVHRDVLRDFEYSRDGRWLATACQDHTARVWDAQTGAPITPWMQHAYECQQTRFSPDGLRLATMASGGTVRLWNSQSGEPFTAPILPTRDSGHARVAFSPDGRWCMSATGATEGWIRDLTPDPTTLEELKYQAEVLSGSRLDVAAGIVPTDNLSLSNAWKQLRALRNSR